MTARSGVIPVLTMHLPQQAVAETPLKRGQVGQHRREVGGQR